MSRRNIRLNPSRSNSRSTRSNQRSNTTASSTSLDFLGVPPSQGGSSTTTTMDTSQSSVSSSAPVRQKRTRKQAQPKRHKRAIEEIRKMQNTTHLLIPRLPFQRVIREVMQKHCADFRLQRLAIEALRESSELYLVQMFSDAVLCTVHGKRATLQIGDIRLLKALAEPREIL